MQIQQTPLREGVRCVGCDTCPEGPMAATEDECESAVQQAVANTAGDLVWSGDYHSGQWDHVPPGCSYSHSHTRACQLH